MPADTKIWIRFSLINLSIVAALGTLMRYKIGFELPFFEQKFLQEAHSHFAFAGWITHTLYFLLVNIFRTALPGINERMYRWLISANLLAAYGMVVSFTCQGYGSISLTFSTLSILTGYTFTWFALKDAGRLPSTHPGKNWIKAALWFGLLSTIGTMVLSWMMATQQFDQDMYFGSIYFYLHFQYNGWFLFACFAIFFDKIRHFILDPKHIHLCFLLFALAGIPAYFLSILWINIPSWIYVIVVIAAFLQIAGWWFFIKLMRRNFDLLKMTFNKTVLLLLVIVGAAMTLKLILQLGSTVPEISKLAFGFRPIVIAYLHLVLLLIVSVFLLTFMYGTGLIRTNTLSKIAILTFTMGAILNEVVLAAQGILGFNYTILPFSNETLFVIAAILLSSALLLATAQVEKSKII
jgi:hypothetical protein